MSFPNYEAYPGQQGAEDVGDFKTSGGTAGANQAQPIMAQQSANSPAPFQGSNTGMPGAAPGDQQSADSKTTLW